MTRKILFFCFVCITILVAKDSVDSDESLEFLRSLTQIEGAQIESISRNNGEDVVSFSNLSLVVGESGVISRDLGAYQVLVGNVDITHVDGTRAIGKITPITQLQQPFLPTPRLNAKEGDKVSFRIFNNKAFIIAPNEETYKAVIEKYSGAVEIINADLLMGFLNSQGKHDPTNKTLSAACSEYAAGLVFIVGSQNLAIFSCPNAKILKKYAFTPLNKDSFQSPFFTRTKFDGGGSLTYLFASKKSREYYQYYDIFIGDLAPESVKK